MLPRFVSVTAVAILASSITVGAKDKEVPRVTIEASKDTVKGILLMHLTSKGYRLDSDTDLQVVFSKELMNVAGVLAGALIGSSNCSLPRDVVTFQIVKMNDALLVLGMEEVETRSGLTCQNQQRVALDGKKNIKAMNEFLAAIKARAEAESPTGDEVPDGKRPGYLGIKVQESEGAVRLSMVLPDCPAGRAGLQAGDVIAAVFDAEVKTAADLREALRRYTAGDDVKLRCIRSGWAFDAKLKLADASCLPK